MYYFKVLYLSHLGFRDQEIFLEGICSCSAGFCEERRDGSCECVNVSDGPCVFEEPYS